MSVQDITSVVTVLLIIVATSIGLYQWIHANRIRRSKFLNQIINRLRFDESISKVMYTIEYSEDWYDEHFHNSEEEYQFDRFFAYLSYVCYLRKSRILKEREFRLLRYVLNRVCQNDETQTYLWNLYHFSQRSNSVCSFDELISYGLKAGILPDDFKQSNTQRFTKYLNF
ncbi:MAG: hypothetical protein BWX66_00351 [Deltaproteobacteria bacterium ADurb.Bin058]|nr:MAG: hypothetical protein BWX66_00351 [Deltaproteobacteria bacterium ADurb.Bin058]